MRQGRLSVVGAAACLAVLATAEPAAARPARASTAMTSQPTVSCTSAKIEFAALSAESEAPITQSVACMVTSAADWELVAVREAMRRRSVAMAPASSSPEPELSVRVATGGWSPLSFGYPTAVAAGTASSVGAIVPLDFRLNVPRGATPGRREMRLRLMLRGESAAEAMTVSYDVPVVLSLTQDPRPFTVSVADPSKPGKFEFDPRTFSVIANVPWKLEASLAIPAAATGQKFALSDDAFQIAGQNGEFIPVAGGNPAVVASGPPTVDGAAPLTIRLAVSTTGTEAGGDYTTRLVFKLQPVTPDP